MPARPGSRVEARVYPLQVELWHGGWRIARHERCHSRRQQVLNLEHYLDVLGHKPGALAGSRPLEQWCQAGRWPACYDVLWDRLRARHGKQDGTRAMVAVLLLGREFGEAPLRAAIASAVSLGASDVAAVRYLLGEAGLHKVQPLPIDVGGRHYNTVCPHSALGYLPPAPEVVLTCQVPPCSPPTSAGSGSATAVLR